MKKLLANLFAPMEATGILLPGVEKPSTTLVKMIAATILQDLPDFDYRGYIKNKKFEIYFNIFNQQVGKTNTYKKVAKDVKLYTPLVSLNKDEERILINAFNRLVDLKEKQKKIDEEEANQHRAVDAIANWMGIE